jgi:hypothetical protein
MALDAKGEFLLARAKRALGEHQVEHAVAKVRAIIGPAEIGDSEPLAQSALNKLHAGETPDPDELAALEIVVRVLRPVVFSHDGSLDDLPDREGQNLQPQDLKDLWSGFQKRVKPLIGSIGRVENSRREHIGTGFLVTDGMLATNRHVLGVLTYGGEALAPSAARVVFGWEDGGQNKREDIVGIDGVRSIHPNLDMVLLAVSKQGRPVLELELAAVPETTRVVTIGYPAQDQINNPLFLASVFQGKFGVKCAAVGEVLDGTESPALFHDCSTTQGSSGSPVFSLTSGLVAGIHRAGYFMYRNEAVDAEQLRKFVQSARP